MIYHWTANRVCALIFPVHLGASLVLALPLWSQTDSTAFDPTIADLMSQVSQDNIRLYIQDLANADGHQSRISYTDGNRWAVRYIQDTFASFAGLSSVILDTFFVTDATPPHDSEPLFNVVATLAGRTNPAQTYIIGGHLDATANLDNNLNWDTDWPAAKAQGADDNATGVAAILEIARILSDPNNAFDNDYTIKFIAFGAEERHPAYHNNNHLGSKHYAQQAFAQREEILGVYVLDMIGYNSTGHDYFNIVSNNKSRDLGEKMLTVNSVYQVALESNRPPFPEVTYSDHHQFWLYRYKAILIIENAPPWQNRVPFYRANPFYHRQGDIFATVNLNQVTKVAQLTLATVASLTSLVTSVGVRPDVPDQPRTFSLFQNYPNPFNGGTLIRYRLLSSGNVNLAIYNLRGQKVASLVKERQPPGDYFAMWDGKDSKGRELSSGIYLYTLVVNEQRFGRKLILNK